MVGSGWAWDHGRKGWASRAGCQTQPRKQSATGAPTSRGALGSALLKVTVNLEPVGSVGVFTTLVTVILPAVVVCMADEGMLRGAWSSMC